MPRCLPRGILRDVETQTNDGAGQSRGYSGEVMTRPAASIEDVLGRRSLDMRGDRPCYGIEMTRVEELRAIAKLGLSIATRSRRPSPTGQEIDVALAG